MEFLLQYDMTEEDIEEINNRNGTYFGFNDWLY